MPRLALLLALALPLAACADDPPAEPTDPDAPETTETADAPMTYEDSAAVIQAQIDSLGALIESDQQRVREGFDHLDSLRGRIDETEADLDETQRRIDEVTGQ